MNQQNPAKLIVVLLALVASVYFLIPTYNYYSLPQEERELNPTQETKELQKKALNLGLDLQGGMHVSLEVNLLELMKTTANNSTLSSGLPSPEFQKFTSVLEEKSKGSDTEFFTLFGEAVSETGIQLATYYGDGDRGISNDEIIAKLKEEATSAIDQALAILRNRVDEFGVSEPIIQKQGDRRIVIELAGVKDKKAALSLIGSSALLEFKLVGDDAKIPDFLSKIDVKLAQNDFKFSAKATESDTASTSSNETSQGLTDFGKTQTDSAKTDSTKKDNLFEPEKNSLFSSLVAHNPGSSEIIVPNKDYAKVMEILSQPYVKEGLIRYEFLPYKREATATNDTPWRFILVNKTAELTGKYITDAAVSMNASTPIPVVSLEMDGEGSHIWARVTGNNINKRIAIALDGKIHSAPVVRSKITGGRSVIEGMGSIDEAKALAIVIKAGALPAPVDIIGLTTVGASLGKDTIEKGKMASYIGAILVVIAMIAAYRMLGVLACVSLGFTMLTIFALLSAFHATLTLPGIAGLALTIGMAVDANVLIYERIREEIDLGKTVHSAIQIGFEKSKSAIYDSNITTFLSGIILYTFGTGPVRGFALTLMVGIITSVFAAIVVTRLLIDFVYKKKDILNVGGVTLLNNKNINFLGYRKYGFIFSLVITFIGIGAVLFGGLNYGIEFKGGTVIEYNFDKNVNIEDVRASLTKVGYGNAEIQTFGDLKNIVIKIDTPEKLEETTQLLKNTLSESFEQQNNPNLESRIETVGPKIGKELKGDAYKSILWALFVILIYMGVRFRSVRFGVAAIAALFHDILVALGVFGMSGMEVSLSVLAAFLTIVGYSLNDTIIVFDRIREDSELHKKRSLIDLMNGSINATLGRTIMTSSTTLLSVLALFLFGGEVIHGFAAALLVGIFTGTYSTIYVASPILILWENYKAKK